MSYREVRVRPVIRYIITEFNSDCQGSAGSETWGEFDNVDRVNVIAHMIAHDSAVRNGDTPAIVEPCKHLKLHWLCGPGETKEAIRWELSEVDEKLSRVAHP